VWKGSDSMDCAKDMYGDFGFEKIESDKDNSQNNRNERISYDDWAKEQYESNHISEVLR